VKRIPRVASRERRPKGSTEPSQPPLGADRDERAAAEPPPLPSGAQPAYQELLHFFNESLDLLCIAGFDGRFKRLNPAWQQALGWTLEELQARPFLDFVHPYDRPATRAEMDKLATGTATITFENRYRCKDGSCTWLQWTARPVPGQREIYAIARDVTRQKHLEEEILATLDVERERVGRELHDGLCQDLAGIAAHCATLARKLAPAAAPESAAAREIGNLLGQSIRRARDLARGRVRLF
jgi:PAS domain S-box-containing protein